MKRTDSIIYVILFVFLGTSISCDRIKNVTRETINKGGETAGKGATEFLEGFSEGVDRTLDCELELSEMLRKSGLETGVFIIGSDSTGGTNNTLSVYLIFNNDINRELRVRVLNKKGQEAGRAKLAVSGKAGEAGYFDIRFDARTYIEVRSKIIFE